jgi:phosphoinositide-3-kinase regulatory subunit 4
MWDLETDQRQMVLWASNAPPLSHTQSGHTVCTMYAGCTDSTSFLLAGGTDMRLRFWDFNMPTASYIAVPAANDVLTPNTLAYELVIYQIKNQSFRFMSYIKSLHFFADNV